MEQVPQETETIAAKRSVRLAEKLSKAKDKIRITQAWWNTVLFEYVILAGLFLLNLYLVLSYFGSNTPQETFYSGPVIPLLSKLLELFGINLLNSFQIVNGIFFVIFPIPFYFFVKVITNRKNIALLSVLFASLPIYPFSSVRILSSLSGVDGAHISSLTFSVVALMCLFSFIKNGGGKNLLLSSLFGAIIALVSPFGISTYLIFAAILTFSEMLLGSGRVKFFRFLSSMFFSATLVSFWYNPSFFFWMITGDLGGEIRRTFSKLLPMTFFAVPTLGVFGYLLFDRKPNLQPVFLASFFTIAFGFISLAGGGIFPSHPSRYVAELGISFSFLTSVVLVKLAESLKFLKDHMFYVRFATVFLFAILSTFILLGERKVRYKDDVLGIWTGVEKGNLWQEKEKFEYGASAIVGYIISFSGASALGYISIKSKK